MAGETVHQIQSIQSRLKEEHPKWEERLALVFEKGRD